MRLIPHPPETRAEARRLGESTTMSCAEIAARLRLAVSTVRSWKRRDGWRRPPGAPTRRAFGREDCHAIARMRALGVADADIARVVRCHPDTVPRAARRGGAAAAAAPAAAALAEFAPEEVAKLHAALLAGGLGKRELLHLAGRALAFATADALIGRDPQADRRAQALARTVTSIKALPDDEPAAGDSLHDRLSVPATFDETSRLLEELARRFAAFDPGRDGGAVPGEPGAGAAAAPA